MSGRNKITLPSGTGGLMRYFDDYKTKINLQPGHIIILILIIILIEVILHLFGYRLLGI